MGKGGFSPGDAYAELLRELSQGRSLTAQAAAKQLGVGEAAARRYLRALAALPIVESCAERPLTIRLAALMKPPPATGTAVAAICLASSLASALRDTPFKKALSDLRSQLVGRSPRAYPTDDLDRKFWFVTRGGEQALPQRTEQLALVVEAILSSHEITFDYGRYSGEREKAVRLEPLTLALYEHQFYVMGRRTGDELFPYRLARMSNVRTMKRFEYPAIAHYDPAQIFAHAFGIIIGNQSEPIEQVRLRFAPAWGPYIASHRWHPSQIASRPDARGAVIVSMSVRCCHELTRWVMSFGADVEVLEPASLRQQIADRHREAATRYERTSLARPGPRVAKTQPPRAPQPAKATRSPR